MKFSLNWIKEFVDVSASPQEIAERLTFAGLEVEGVTEIGKGLEKVLTATILKCERHPNADRLSVCEVRAKDKNVSLVCGASNMKVGDVVALAPPGITLPNGMTLQETVIRKVKSSGMLCSETELGLAAESEGILILNPKTPEGIPLTQALPLQDTVFEVNVTPNRGDCLSMIGLAREIAAVYGTSLKLNLHEASAGRSSKAKGSAAPSVVVHNEAGDLCPRYSCRVIRGIKVGRSPETLQRRLAACGIRAINNIVDATNYVMLELGQPLHAFDLKQIRQGKVVIRRAKAGEPLKTLDEKEQKLEANDLVIADAQRILALAGVMGGQDSGVENSTADLLLESAHFSPTAVRKTSKRLGMQSESSYRFERGVDPSGCVAALQRLTALILEIAGGEASPEIVDVYPHPQPIVEISLRCSQIPRILGIDIPHAKYLPPLRTLGIEGQEKSKGQILFQIPTFRTDLRREIDLIEEIARVYGYHHIPVHYPEISLEELSPPRKDPLDRVQEILTGWGFSEVVQYSFTSPQLLKKFGEKQAEELTLINPISEEMSVMRPALFPQMIQTIQQNVFNGNKNLRLFETRPVYHFEKNSKSPILEEWHLCMAMSGNRRPLHVLEKEEPVSLLDLKGYLQGLVESQTGGSLVEQPLDKSFFHPRRQLNLLWNPPAGPASSPSAVELGFLGELHPAFREEWGLSVPVVVAEINLDLFLTETKNLVQFQRVSLFPSVWRDLNLVLDEDTPHGEVLKHIRAHGGLWIQRVELFDEYRGKPLEAGKKALTYTLEYATPDRTLTDEEVNEAREKLLFKLKEKIGAQLR